jgi:RNA polymerase sigma factor (TIGR02999 family)
MPAASIVTPTDLANRPKVAAPNGKSSIPVDSHEQKGEIVSDEACAAEGMNDATALLKAIDKGDAKSAEQLLDIVYHELRRLAAFKMSQQAPGQTLQPTALVHEAWLKLVGAQNPSFKDQAHFFSAAAEAMRHILIDRARRKQTHRHGGDFERAHQEEFELAAPGPDDQLLAVNEALDKFALKYPAQAEVVKLRYFAGMNNEEVSRLLGISTSCVKNYWNFSRAWLFKQIAGE